MRISDWSSDVCSSDLNEPALQRDADDEERDRHQHDCVAEADALRQENGEIRRDQIERAVGEVDHAERAEDERSEEHTSELQSLMRISYAVFCLKKKNKTHKKKQSQQDNVTHHK